ncbi:MAG: hypothetical protein ACKVJU_17540 [Verrucomicrobiales bacterium]
MTNRLNFIADPELAAVSGLLQERLDGWVGGLDPSGFEQLLDPVMQTALHRSFTVVNGAEGTVWLIDQSGENLVAVFNSGPQAEELIGFKQPLGKGIISMVYSHERPYCENDIAKEKAGKTHDDTLDKKIGTATAAMIAVPFHFGFGLRGVISCVQLKNQEDASGFDSENIDEISAAVSVVERLIDGRLITAAMGLEDA